MGEYVLGIVGMARMVGGSGAFLVPASVLCALAAAYYGASGLGGRAARTRDAVRPREVALLFAPAAVALLLIPACAVAFGRDPGPPWAEWPRAPGLVCLLGALAAVFAVAGWVAWRVGAPLRPAAVALAMVQTWWACLAAWIAAMAVTGNWI